jgi:hypothetical protein
MSEIGQLNAYKPPEGYTPQWHTLRTQNTILHQRLPYERK